MSLSLQPTPQLARPSNIADKEEVKFSSSGHDIADNKMSGEGQVLPKNQSSGVSSPAKALKLFNALRLEDNQTKLNN